MAFGLGFSLVPAPLAEMFTDAAPATHSAVIDMRATYGGTALGVAIIFALCARNEDYLKLGVQGLLAVMTGLAAARSVGILSDREPNLFMLGLLVAEVTMVILAFAALTRFQQE